MSRGLDDFSIPAPGDCGGMEKMVEWTKKKMVKDYQTQCGGNVERQWLEAHVDSYAEKDYRVAVYVLEGSPAKAWFVVDFGREIITMYNFCTGKIHMKKRW